MKPGDQPTFSDLTMDSSTPGEGVSPAPVGNVKNEKDRRGSDRERSAMGWTVEEHQKSRRRDIDAIKTIRTSASGMPRGLGIPSTGGTELRRGDSGCGRVGCGNRWDTR